MSFGVTLLHVVPPFFVTCTRPSSLPVQIVLTSRFDGPIEKITAYTSGPFMSPVIGPPEWPIVSGLWRVRSPEIAVQLWPSVVVFQSRCDPAYNTLGFTGEKMIGYVHCQRSGMSFA